MGSYLTLKKYVAKGYLLHGSGKKFKELKPNKRRKLDPRAGRLKAVYATDDPLLAMFLAVLNSSALPLINGQHKSLVGWFYDSEDNIRTAVTPNFFKHNAFGKGYAYALERLPFRRLKKLPHEFYSFRVVKPVKVVEVTPDELFLRNKPDVYPREAVREAGFHTEKEIRLMGY